VRDRESSVLDEPGSGVSRLNGGEKMRTEEKKRVVSGHPDFRSSKGKGGTDQGR